MDVKEKVVIVTGAGSGIGAATALMFGSLGAKVVASDIALDKVDAIAEEIRGMGSEAIAVQTDVSDYAAFEALVNQTVETFGQLDVLVNNAGIGPKILAKTGDSTLEDWDRVVAVNQTGVFYGMKLAFQQMVPQGHGNIVNVASLAGLKASGNNISYAASKFAVVGMTKAAALEYASRNIRVNAVCPGYTHSALLDRFLNTRPDMDQILLQYIPLKRFGEAKEIAEAIVWLASPSTGFITGQTITLDGGASL